MYKNDLSMLEKAVRSFLDSEFIFRLYLIDNSPTQHLRSLATEDRIKYCHNSSNIGFGAAHNMAFKMAIEIGSCYHFVANPDVFFEKEVIAEMVNYIDSNQNVGMIMPQILNFDGSIQYLPKLLPSPGGILLRKFKYPPIIYQRFINNYELRFVKQNVIYDAPILSGCFLLCNLRAIEDVGMFDDNYFMYFEDWDLSRRMHQKYRTVYFPFVSVFHGYERGAGKSFRLFNVFLHSAFIYFCKWGWFFDKERRAINSIILNQF
jgi:GT2 family glycosyltransferase